VGESNAAGAGGLGGVDLSSGGNGVYGVSNAGNGVHGIVGGFSGAVPSQPIGVLGETNLSGGVGVYGSSAGGYGVGGYSTVSDGVSGGTAADGQSGVSGFDVSATGGYGLYGQSEVIGGVGVLAKNTGQGPQLLLSPSTNTALPATSSPGQFIVLSDGSLWYSYLTNEWVQLNNGIVALPAPVRVIDTTSSGGSVGGIAGPLVPGATVHTTSVLTGGASNIPAQALGLVGNFAISGVGGALLNGFGVATIFPAGSSTPATANINAGAGCFAISNSVTVRFGTGTSAGRLSIVWSGGGPVPEAQAFFDVTGYLL
jgi:hypothetical protein